MSCHIGSQILDPTPILEALDRVLELAAALRAQGHPIAHLDLGGGLGISYHSGEKAPPIRAFIESVRERLRASGLTVMVEPGRSIVGAGGSAAGAGAVSEAERRRRNSSSWTRR